MTEQKEQERTLRIRSEALQEELRGLLRQAASLFRTSGWIRVEDEPPPVDLQVLGVCDPTDVPEWYTLLHDGKWRHTYYNGHCVEGRHGPTFWLVLPPVPG